MTKMEVTTYIWPEPVTGTWNIEIKSDVAIPHPPGKPEVYLLFGFESSMKLSTHLNTYDLQVGQEVGLVARYSSSSPSCDFLRSFSSFFFLLSCCSSFSPSIAFFTLTKNNKSKSIFIVEWLTFLPIWLMS